MPTGHDPTRLFRAPTSPRCSYKLGAQATWSKVKYSAQTSTRGAPSKGRHVVKFGYNGEVVVGYANAVEVWDWVPSALQVNEQDKKKEKEVDVAQRAMYLVASLTGIQGHLEDVVPLVMDQLCNSYTVMLAVRVKSEMTFVVKRFGQLFEEDFVEQPLILPPLVYGSAPYLSKGSEKFVAIATDEGSLTVFDPEHGRPLPLSFDVHVAHGRALFDIAGRYMAYVASEDTPPSTEPCLTKMDVPSHNHSIYTRILQNLSLTAIDGLNKLSDINSLKKMLNDKSLSSNLKAYISNLINGFKKSQRVVVMDLVTQTVMCSFQPPNGVSNLSLSPFNTHLVTTTQRGDQVYKWDMTRAPLEVSLLDIQVRGKTASIVDEIHWTSNEVFQIVTRSSGSIHCFHSEVSKNWVLPNMHASKLCQVKDELVALVGDDLCVVDQRGNSNAKYTLPQSAIPGSLLPDDIPLTPVDEIIERTKDVERKTPLAQVEIETCFMGQPAYASEKLELATYEDDDEETYWSSDRVFGDEFRTKTVEFRKGNGQAVFCGERDDLESALSSVLVFDDGL